MAEKNMNFRFYEKEMPDIDELIHVQVKRVTDACAYVALSEYAGIEGMILLAELSTKRIRSLQKEIRVGQYDVMMVLKTDDKGGIELSRRRVQAEDKKKFVEKYAASKLVQAVLKQICSHHDELTMEDLCTKIAWPLYKSDGHPVNVFKRYVNDHDDTWAKNLAIPDKVREELLAEVTRRLSPSASRLKAQIEVGCQDFEGVVAVKNALLAGEKAANTNPDVNPVQVKVVSAPLYEVVTTSMGVAAGQERIEVCLEAIKKSIEGANGTFVCKSKPEAVQEMEEIKNGDESSEDEQEASDDDGMQWKD